jgi:hypothetical protein
MKNYEKKYRKKKIEIQEELRRENIVTIIE